MPPEVLRYAAFTDDPRGGNPAGVVLDAAGTTDAEMLAVAAEPAEVLVGEHRQVQAALAPTARPPGAQATSPLWAIGACMPGRSFGPETSGQP